MRYLHVGAISVYVVCTIWAGNLTNMYTEVVSWTHSRSPHLALFSSSLLKRKINKLEECIALWGRAWANVDITTSALYLSPSALLIFPAFLWLSLPHVEASPVLSCAVACLPYLPTVLGLIWKYLEYPCSLQVTKPGLHMLDHTPFACTWHAYACIGHTT